MRRPFCGRVLRSSCSECHVLMSLTDFTGSVGFFVHALDAANHVKSGPFEIRALHGEFEAFEGKRRCCSSACCLCFVFCCYGFLMSQVPRAFATNRRRCRLVTVRAVHSGMTHIISASVSPASKTTFAGSGFDDTCSEMINTVFCEKR